MSTIFDQVCTNDDLVSMLEAPTGWGKTLGVIDWLKNHRLKAVIVFPTRSCISHLPTLYNITYCTAMEWLHNKKEYDVVVIDECHTVSKEYQLVFRVLQYMLKKHRMKKILFMTASLDEDRMKQIFPMGVVNRVEDVNPRFKIETTYFYENYLVRSPQSHFITASGDLVDMWKELVENSHRILIFVASHQQCEVLMKSLVAKDDRYRYLCYSGQMEDRNVCDYYLYKKTDERICVISTNILESAVTIPGIDVVIDFGVHYFKNGDSLRLEFCDRFNMIQRRGRTGRTCDGRVIRMMNQTCFDELPFQTIPVHSIEWDVFTCQTLNLPTSEIFESDELDIFRRRVEEMDLLRNGSAHDYVHSPFTTTTTAMLLSLKNSEKYRDILVLAIMMYEFSVTTYKHLVYFPANTIQSHKKILLKIRLHFGQYEETILWMNIVITLLLNKHACLDIAKEFCLNFRSYRVIKYMFHRALTFLRCASGDLYEHVSSCVRQSYNVHNLSSDGIEAVRRFFFNDIRMKRVMSTHDHEQTSSISLRRNMISVFPQLYGFYEYDPVYFIPIVSMRIHEHYQILYMWVRAPISFQLFHNNLKHLLVLRFDESEKKRIVKEEYSARVVRFIDEIIARFPLIIN